MDAMMTTAAQTDILTAADLLRLYGAGVRGELIRGEFRETMPSGGVHGEVAGNMAFLINAFVKPRRLGRVAVSDSGVLLERDPDTVREPDLAFISAARLPLSVRVRGYYEIVPDLVVEIASPSDSRRAVRAKALMWLDFGARTVWAADPQYRSVDVYRPNAPALRLSENDTLDGGEVLPGFACAVSEIFDV